MANDSVHHCRTDPRRHRGRVPDLRAVFRRWSNPVGVCSDWRHSAINQPEAEMHTTATTEPDWQAIGAAAISDAEHFLMVEALATALEELTEQASRHQLFPREVRNALAALDAYYAADEA